MVDKTYGPSDEPARAIVGCLHRLVRRALHGTNSTTSFLLSRDESAGSARVNANISKSSEPSGRFNFRGISKNCCKRTPPNLEEGEIEKSPGSICRAMTPAVPSTVNTPSILNFTTHACRRTTRITDERRQQTLDRTMALRVTASFQLPARGAHSVHPLVRRWVVYE